MRAGGWFLFWPLFSLVGTPKAGPLTGLGFPAFYLSFCTKKTGRGMLGFCHCSGRGRPCGHIQSLPFRFSEPPVVPLRGSLSEGGLGGGLFWPLFSLVETPKAGPLTGLVFPAFYLSFCTKKNGPRGARFLPLLRPWAAVRAYPITAVSIF